MKNFDLVALMQSHADQRCLEESFVNFSKQVIKCLEKLEDSAQCGTSLDELHRLQLDVEEKIKTRRAHREQSRNDSPLYPLEENED